ncbi:monovalent cation/H+ antiporter complex subunit F [Corynebacterium glucuronolyticum]|uniref:Cation:proton antiporter n=2 Tax=Corynebacterium glucuronolyticum TaxID=39791 RepID=A0A7T4JVS4_9CORY|nr:monovalent cation/H+ antiporter complex subunit F [Corynebacterium glucuronolyticum]EEI26007.1 putative monovalent cation/H+ antiporter subunit F [Corynebacterium glucuronolyticum ATCC 51867]EEI64142.1 putative monovalent cation/H+ antiporter subunit F [Corynebacterium glucuronolyticum ATCC 51866]MCT1563528.1 monovalent cation/H+ antiporter complex subunit F [Corynebacterium glucuronolyticum]QQB47160.1 cation:proton antiporter [Corynebacterium glucuronolyticum]QQU88819.1 cation:proton antip
MMYHILLLIAAVMFAVAFLLVGYRMLVGPNSMDRMQALDTTVAILQCALGAYICWSLDTTVVNAMVVLALLGFISSVAVTRFRKRDE